MQEKLHRNYTEKTAFYASQSICRVVSVENVVKIPMFSENAIFLLHNLTFTRGLYYVYKYIYYIIVVRYYKLHIYRV